MSTAIVTAVLASSLFAGAPDKKSCDAASVYASLDALYSIKGASAADRAYFHKKPAASAKEKRSLGVGDHVLAGGPKTEDFRCVLFGDDKGELVTGFISVANLQRIDRDEGELSQDVLAGQWVSRGFTINIEKLGDDMVKATVRGKSKSQLEVDAKVSNRKINFVEDVDDENTCRLTIEKKGPYLFASDNAHCGPDGKLNGIFAKVKK